MRKVKKNNFFLVLILVTFFCLSIGYAVIGRQLQINGNSEVKQNTWDIHFENIILLSNSVSNSEKRVISSDNLSVNFNVSLNLPGDFYAFTVDVVNLGTIDGMIESISKNPELSEEQKKYLNYTIEYQSGDTINSKQLVESNSYVRLKVVVEYRSDITEFDLPTTTQNLNLGFTVCYVQADDTGSVVLNNGLKTSRIKAFTTSWDEMTGLSLYDALKNKHSEEDLTYTFFVDYNDYVVSNYDTHNYFVDDNGKLLNLKKTIIEEDKNYESVYGTTSFNIDEIENINYNTLLFDVYLYDNLNADSMNLLQENMYYFYTEFDIYSNLILNTLKYLFYLDPNGEVVNDYILGLLTNDSVNIHIFTLLFDSNYNFLKLSD